VAQFSNTQCAIFEPMFLNNNRIQLVGDATAATDAMNQRSADARYMRPGGPALTDTLTTKPGTGVNDLGLAIGDGATGFYRDAAGTGAGLATMVGGFPLFMLLSTREAVINGPLSVGGNRVMAVGNPAAGSDALNLQTGDARYLTLQQGGIVAGAVQFLFNPILPTDAVTKGYVDAIGGPRARPIVFDIPADVVIPASGVWTTIATVPVTLPPRPGVTSLLMFTINCNLKGVNNVNGVGVRVPAAQEQRVFGFGPNGTDDSAGLSVNIVVSPAPGTTQVDIPVQMNSFTLTAGAPIAYTVEGGNAVSPTRSQIIVTDLGPV
jgi:hypothetical protein